MASEIRVNKITNRAGLSTVEYTDTGIVVSGISTFNGNVDINADLDVDGHTNLDNVSIAGVTTFGGSVNYPVGAVANFFDDVNFKGPSGRDIVFDKSHAELHFSDDTTIIMGTNDDLFVTHDGTNPSILTKFGTLDIKTSQVAISTNMTVGGILTATTLDINGDIDVDGHTNLDNVSIAGIVTISHTGSNQLTIKDSDTSGNGSSMRISFKDSGDTERFYIGNDEISNSYLYLGSPSGQNNNVALTVGGSTKLTAFSGGIGINGDLELQDTIYHAGDTNTKIRFPAADTVTVETGGSERLRITSDGKIGIGRNDPVNFVDIARGQDEENILVVRGADNTSEYGAIGISGSYYYITGGGAGSTSTGIMFRTAASGNETNRLEITSSGHVEPATDNTYNFGSLTKRWANIYSADLNLSNEGSKNDVDGTWGNYTIQEGQDDLFLINKRNGKKYMFVLKEVS